MYRVKTILASSSPRRKELLNLTGIFPRIIVPDINEKRVDGEMVDEFLQRVAKEKAEIVDVVEKENSLVISADTVVIKKGELIGKPGNRGDAEKMLLKLSGETHFVKTSLCLKYMREEIITITETSVEFMKMNREEIRFYLDNENYSDKAGGYAVQGIAALFIRKIKGCFFNVMGFPLNEFYISLGKLGLPIEKLRNSVSV